MSCYLELPLGLDKGMGYFHAKHVWHVSHALTYRAHRIWEERPDGSVHYVKLRSRYLSDMSQVDMKEFMCVKLRSRPVRDFQ